MKWKGSLVLCVDEEGEAHSLMSPVAVGNLTAPSPSCLFPDSSPTGFHRDTILILLRRVQYPSPLHQQGKCQTKPALELPRIPSYRTDCEDKCFCLRQSQKSYFCIRKDAGMYLNVRGRSREASNGRRDGG